MTKVTPDDAVEQEKEDGEIIETYDFNNIDEQMTVKHDESDHLTGERDFHPPLGGETSSQLARDRHSSMTFEYLPGQFLQKIVKKRDFP